MAQELVEVIAVVGEQQGSEPRDRRIRVKTLAKAVCAKCEATGGCKRNIFAWWPRPSYLIANNLSLKCKPGDQLIVEMAESQLLRAAILVYLLPLGCLMISLILASLASLSELAQIICGISSLVGGIYLAGILATRYITAKDLAIVKSVTRSSSYTNPYK
jgi:positive regulator of sigma E activity